MSVNPENPQQDISSEVKAPKSAESTDEYEYYSSDSYEYLEDSWDSGETESSSTESESSESEEEDTAEVVQEQATEIIEQEQAVEVIEQEQAIEIIEEEEVIEIIEEEEIIEIIEEEEIIEVIEEEEEGEQVKIPQQNVESSVIQTECTGNDEVVDPAASDLDNVTETQVPEEQYVSEYQEQPAQELTQDDQIEEPAAEEFADQEQDDQDVEWGQDDQDVDWGQGDQDVEWGQGEQTDGMDDNQDGGYFDWDNEEKNEQTRETAGECMNADSVTPEITMEQDKQMPENPVTESPKKKKKVKVKVKAKKNGRKSTSDILDLPNDLADRSNDTEDVTDPVSEEKPASVPEEKPAPVPEEKPAPVPEEKPAPVPEEKPAPVPEKKPAPVPEKKRTTVPEKSSAKRAAQARPSHESHARRSKKVAIEKPESKEGTIVKRQDANGRVHVLRRVRKVKPEDGTTDQGTGPRRDSQTRRSSKDVQPVKDRRNQRAQSTLVRPKKISSSSSSSEEEVNLDQVLEDEDARIEAVYQFNSNPKKNIGVLCAYYKKDPTPANIVHVIKTTPGLLGDKIGEYLVRPENAEIMRAYFDDVDMHCNFLDAIRRGLAGPFFLPGEAQQIDRTVHTLCTAYMAQNPGIFNNEDDPYVLSFALIMLNTDMLKPNVTNKMTVQQFIVNTRGSLKASQLTDADLEEMYHSLKANPFQFSQTFNADFMAMSAPKIRGNLKKKSKRAWSSWSEHYFVLANSCLYYFKDNTPANKDRPLGMIQLTEVEVKADPESKLRFIIEARGEAGIPYIKFKKNIPSPVPNIMEITLEAPDKKLAEKWLHRLTKSAILSVFQAGGGDAPDFNETVSDTTDSAFARDTD